MTASRSPAVALGREVRSARSTRRLSLRELGGRIGVSPSLVSQIERAQVRPSLATLVALAVELELSLDATFGLRPVASTSAEPHHPPHYKGVAMTPTSTRTPSGSPS